jgi:hypothetical protein
MDGIDVLAELGANGPSTGGDDVRVTARSRRREYEARRV